MTVSRVLVYRYECPGHDRLSVGLVRLPPTQAPVSGSVSVTPYCAENSHFPSFSNPTTLRCSSEGFWFNGQTVCECDTGFVRVGVIIPSPSETAGQVSLALLVSVCGSLGLISVVLILIVTLIAVVVKHNR